MQRRLKDEQEAKRRAEDELRRKEEADRRARLQAEEEKRRREEAAREAERRAEAARTRKLEEERLAKQKDEAERKRQFDEQLAAWERVKESTDLAAIEQFVYRYPSSQFTDLAQLRLDQLLARQGEKRIEIVSAPENPYTKGTARADTAFKVGDTWSFRTVNRNKDGEVTTYRHVVTSITESEVIINDGRVILDLLGNILQTSDGRRFTGGQDMALEYALGRHWKSRSIVTVGQNEGFFEAEYRVAARERITVPAGTFDCFKVVMKGDGLMRPPKGPVQVSAEVTCWIAPAQVRRQVARETLRRVFPLRGTSFIAQWDRQELTAYQQS